MNRLFGIILMISLVFMLTVALITQSSAQAGRFQYAVKFVCGIVDGRVAVRGTYLTAINVHNPTYETVPFRYKVAVARTGFTSGPITRIGSTGLKADAALEIDCMDIWRLTNTKEGLWLKGFLVIETDRRLDVLGVYTAAGRDQYVTTLEIERVEPTVR